MALSANYVTKVLTIPESDLTGVSPDYTYDLDTLSDEMRALSASSIGIDQDYHHDYTGSATLGSVVLAPVVAMVNGWTIEFEDGAYLVELTGANSDILDFLVHNQVSVRQVSSAGLVVTATSGLTTNESAMLLLIQQLLMNRVITDPGTGKFTVYADDDMTVLMEADIFEDAAGATPYAGQGAERRDRLAP
jgi:hypothetical protein